MKIDNDFLMKMDSEVILMCMSKEFGGLDKEVSEISYLEFRNRLYKKYYDKEADK